MKRKIGLCSVIIWLALSNPISLFAQVDAKTSAVATIETSGETMVYNTYCLIGTLNDGYWYNTWTKESTLNWLDEQIKSMSDAEIQYSSLLNSGFVTNTSDSTYISDLSMECDYLKTEAYDLQNYINNPSDETRQTYMTAR